MNRIVTIFVTPSKIQPYEITSPSEELFKFGVEYNVLIIKKIRNRYQI